MGEIVETGWGYTEYVRGESEITLGGISKVL